MGPKVELTEVYVHPGEWRIVYEPSVVRTVLGSCVGITFWAPRLGIAVLSHQMLPALDGRRVAAASLSDCRKYVDCSIREIAQVLESKGVTRRETEVKLFGGADVLTVVNPGARPTVGRLNYESALRVLDEEGFHISASRLGGQQAYHLSFYTDTGEVRVRRLECIAGEVPAEPQLRPRVALTP